MGDRTDRNWRNAVIAILALACVNIFLVGLYVTQYQRNNEQDVQLAAAEAKLEAADNLRESERKAAAARAKVACALAWNASDLANGTIANIRKTVLDLADAVTRPEVIQTLREDATLFKPFAQPTCPRPKNPNAKKPAP